MMIKVISATSLFMEYNGDLLVERPGFEVAKTRRAELSGFIERVAITRCAQQKPPLHKLGASG